MVHGDEPFLNCYKMVSSKLKVEVCSVNGLHARVGFWGFIKKGRYLLDANLSWVVGKGCVLLAQLLSSITS